MEVPTTGSNLQELEDLVICSIHLGRLNDARLLPCGHTFCRKCIDECLHYRRPEEGSRFHCPECRNLCDLATAFSLPRAIADNKLVDHLTSTENYVCRERDERRFGGSLNDLEENPPYTALLSVTEIPFHASAILQLNGSTRTLTISNSSLNSCDQDAIRVKMHKFRRYGISQRFYATHSRRPSGAFSISCTRSASGSNVRVTCADIYCQNNDVGPSETIIVMINDMDHTLIVRNNQHSSIKSIVIEIKSYAFHPIYLKVHRQRIYMTGIVQSPNPVGVLIECRLDGKLIRVSPEYPVTSATIPPICGFWIDSNTGNIFVALTSEQRIVELSPTLVETGMTHIFYGFYPSYLIRKADSSEIWLSCPKNGRLIVLNEVTGQFSQIGTHKIYQAVPSHIIFTTDHRIMFLDSSQKRVFWIDKERDYILVQSLLIDEKQTDLEIRSITAVDNDQILFGFVKKVWLAKPLKSIKTADRSSTGCHLL